MSAEINDLGREGVPSTKGARERENEGEEGGMDRERGRVRKREREGEVARACQGHLIFS